MSKINHFLLGILIFIISAFLVTGGLLKLSAYLKRFLRIKRIKIEGADEKLKKKILMICNLKSNPKSLLFLNTKRLKKMIEMNPWIESVTVKKLFPDTVIIKVKKEVPCAVLIYKGNLFYVNKKGEAFKIPETYRDLPVITGIKQDMKDRIRKVIRLLDRINNRRLEVSEVHVTKYGTVHLYFCKNRFDLVFSYDIDRLNEEEIKKNLKN